MKTLEKTRPLNEKLLTNIYEGYSRGIINDTDLVQIITLGFDLLNLTSISNYAKEHGKTYRGVPEYCKDVVNINDFKFVINNK